MIKFRNVLNHHNINKVSIHSIDDTETDVRYFHDFFMCNFVQCDSFDFHHFDRSVQKRNHHVCI